MCIYIYIHIHVYPNWDENSRGYMIPRKEVGAQGLMVESARASALALAGVGQGLGLRLRVEGFQGIRVGRGVSARI